MLSTRALVVVGFALFAMFFGAGNLIFPPTLGRLFGEAFPWAAAGFLLTGVGLPFLGILAVARAGGGLERIAGKLGPICTGAISVIVMLAIGPLLAIPRTCATTFELSIAPNLPGVSSWVFSLIYFGIVLAFTLRPAAVVEQIGMILTPVLLLALLVLIGAGIADPIASPVAMSSLHPFGRGFVEGYQTMDLLAATVFGIVILKELRNKGIAPGREQVAAIIKAGLIAAGTLGLVYCGLLYLGATMSASAETLTRTELLVAISTKLLGVMGCVTLGAAVAMACLTTAIGLLAACGDYFSRITSGRLSYRTVCIAGAVISLLFSNAGVERIVRIALPPLVALYPVVATLVILTLLGRLLASRAVWRGAVAGAFFVGLLQSARAAGVHAAGLNAALGSLPLADHGLGWLLPAAASGSAWWLISLAARLLRRARPITQAA